MTDGTARLLGRFNVDIFLRHSEAGVVRRDANEIWPTNEVMLYQSGFGAGSPSLHSNLFRYALLHRLGGWWVDLDVVMLGAELPADDRFFAYESYGLLANGTLAMVANHALLAEAINTCVSHGQMASWARLAPNSLQS